MTCLTALITSRMWRSVKRECEWCLALTRFIVSSQPQTPCCVNVSSKSYASLRPAVFDASRKKVRVCPHLSALYSYCPMYLVFSIPIILYSQSCSGLDACSLTCGLSCCHLCLFFSSSLCAQRRKGVQFVSRVTVRTFTDSAPCTPSTGACCLCLLNSVCAS